MLISLVFGNFSNERGCISSESAHTWSSKVRRLTCRNFEQSLIGEVRMLCFPRRTNSTANTVSHHGVHLFFTWIDKYCPRFTNTLQAWGKQTWKISFRKCLWNFCFNGCYVFFRWKAREFILWTCCPKPCPKRVGIIGALRSCTPWRETVWPQLRLNWAQRKRKRMKC